MQYYVRSEDEKSDPQSHRAVATRLDEASFGPAVVLVPAADGSVRTEAPHGHGRVRGGAVVAKFMALVAMYWSSWAVSMAVYFTLS
jgi:hypothetical protein